MSFLTPTWQHTSDRAPPPDHSLRTSEQHKRKAQLGPTPFFFFSAYLNAPVKSRQYYVPSSASVQHPAGLSLSQCEVPSLRLLTCTIIWEPLLWVLLGPLQCFLFRNEICF